MKRLTALILTVILCFSIIACNNTKTPPVTDDDDIPSIEDNGGAGNNTDDTADTDGDSPDLEGHTDDDNDKYCDDCGILVVTTFDFYAINDLHGKFVTSSNTVGVEGLTTYLKKSAARDDNPVFLSSGDMWQGGAQSNLTKGLIVTDWMNSLGFASMTLGNHEFDWGESYVEKNAELAKFPFLAINIYEKSTNEQVDYCESSVIVECNGLQVGIIGAAGDNYSSISSDKVQDIYFKTGSALTALVKAESQKLRAAGADIIVYSLHDGYGQSTTGTISDSALSSYYDVSLSDGYVDLVFEGHTHRGYVLRDSKNVYHLQNSGDNGGITHAELEYNFANKSYVVTQAEHVTSDNYDDLEADAVVGELLEKYKDTVSKADEVLGKNDVSRDKNTLRSIVAKLYFEAGNERWGDKYDIVLGGGFMTVRSPGYLHSGTVTYADLEAILPFDNQIVLCSIRGRDLVNKFLNTSNSNYFIYCGDYGNSIKNNIDYNATYYVITDTYSSQYTYNNLTEVARYDETTFARDLLADYIKAGNLTVS